MNRAAVIVITALYVAACSNSTPAEPAPLQTMTFQSDTTAPVARSFFFLQTIRGQGQITVSLNANQMTACMFLRGTILFDPAIVTYVDFSEGDWFKQNGALATFSVKPSNGTIEIAIDRPTSLPGATGNGSVMMLRFRPANSTVKGTSPLQWTFPHCYASATLVESLARAHNGTITVQ